MNFSYLDAFLKKKRVDALYTFCPNLRRPHSVEIKEFYSQNLNNDFLVKVKLNFQTIDLNQKKFFQNLEETVET